MAFELRGSTIKHKFDLTGLDYMVLIFCIFPSAQFSFQFCVLPKNKEGANAPITPVPATMFSKLLYLKLSRFVL